MVSHDRRNSTVLIWDMVVRHVFMVAVRMRSRLGAALRNFRDTHAPHTGIELHTRPNRTGSAVSAAVATTAACLQACRAVSPGRGDRFAVTSKLITRRHVKWMRISHRWAGKFVDRSGMQMWWLAVLMRLAVVVMVLEMGRPWQLIGTSIGLLNRKPCQHIEVRLRDIVGLFRGRQQLAAASTFGGLLTPRWRVIAGSKRAGFAVRIAPFGRPSIWLAVRLLSVTLSRRTTRASLRTRIRLRPRGTAFSVGLRPRPGMLLGNRRHRRRPGRLHTTTTTATIPRLRRTRWRRWLLSPVSLICMVLVATAITSPMPRTRRVVDDHRRQTAFRHGNRLLFVADKMSIHVSRPGAGRQTAVPRTDQAMTGNGIRLIQSAHGFREITQLIHHGILHRCPACRQTRSHHSSNNHQLRGYHRAEFTPPESLQFLQQADHTHAP